MTCKWLPSFYEYPDWSNYFEYENKLYSFFRSIYLDKTLYFNNKALRYRFHPRDPVTNREEVFYHLTCKVYKEAGETKRDPDPDRIIRIKYPRAYMENYLCKNDCCENKPLYWIKDNKHKIFYENYFVILEERNDYFLFITGYFVSEEYYRKGLIKECKKFS